jgi:hypothetical protein
MDVAAQKPWPEAETSGAQSPIEIEKFLRSEIIRRQVTLIGELDLVEPTTYAGINWSLLDLANYLVSKPIIRSTLTNTSTWSNGIWPYPATLAIWSVGHAQTEKDGNKLWELLEDYSTSQKSKLAELFYQAVSNLGLEMFEGELENAQKYVQLARIHAMIPDFAIERYAEIINRGVKFNRPKIQMLNEITTDTTISKGVQRLFSGNPTIGLDLIERSFNFLAYGYQIDLPDRIKTKLSSTTSLKKNPRKARNFPQILFVEWERNLEIRGATGWRIEDQDGNEMNHQSLKPNKVFVSSENSEKIEIFNPDNGYFIFDLDGNLTDGRYLPSEGGFLIWNRKVEILSEIPHIESGYISGADWNDWQYSYFQDVAHLEVRIDNEIIRTLFQKKSLSVKLSPVTHLVDINRDQVFSEYPVLEERQFLKITDNLTEEQWSLEGELGPIIRGQGGSVDLNMSAGLGKSKICRGLIIPGIVVRGLDTSLKLREKRKVSIKFRDNWKVTYPSEFVGQIQADLDVYGDPESEVPMIKVLDPTGIEHFIGLEIPILSWSVEYTDRENEMVASHLEHKIEDRRKIQALILHEIDEYVPILKVGEVSILGRQRGRDVRYDLRFLQDDNRDESTEISITWSYESLELVSFRKIPTKKSLIIKDFKDLLDASIKADIISLESWNEYKSTKVAESKLLKARRRNLRGIHQ